MPKTMKLRPNIFLVILVIFCFGAFGLLGIGAFFFGGFIVDEGSFGLGVFTFVLAIGCFVMIWLLWKSFKEKFLFVSLDKHMLRIHKPLINKRIEVQAERIKGYSKSLDDSYYGGPVYLKKKVLTIYFTDELKPIELVQYQVARVQEFEEELNNRGIEFLGNEEIHRDMYGQRAKFEYE